MIFSIIVFARYSAKIAMMLITVIAFCEKLEQMTDNVDQSLIIGVLSKLLPFLVSDKGEKTMMIGRNSPISRRNGEKLEPFTSFQTIASL